jgi:tetratricopeptide (TPR) repeat protein
MKTTMTGLRLILSRSLALVLAASGMAAAAANPVDDARAAFKARDYVRAATLLAPATSDASRDAEAFHLLSQVRLAEKNASKAVKLSEKATALDPSQSDYFSQLGVALGTRMSEVGFMQQAVLAGKLKKAFERAVELNPNDIGALLGLSQFYSRAPEIAGGSRVKAKELAERVRELAPFRGELELGALADQEGNHAEALEHYAAAAKANPAHAWAQHLCGRTLVKLGRVEEARERFNASLRNDPAFERSRQALAALDTRGTASKE